jgi:hypothetical protein
MTVMEGAGVRLRRMFGYPEVPAFDPFLMLDDFRSDTPSDYTKGFPWHPHRGIETVTYLLRGEVEHGDSLGNRGLISADEVQWMTAGGGIVHQEMPEGDETGAMHGFQLWVNLPAHRKMIPPRYRGISADQIPEVVLQGGVRIKVIAGSAGGADGPVEGIDTAPEFFDVTVPAGEKYRHPAPAGRRAFVYVIGGAGHAGEAPVENRTLVLFSDQGDYLTIHGGNEPIRFLLLTGQPLDEPIAWRGPIVMNTEAELDTAFQEYRDGTFIRNAAAG